MPKSKRPASKTKTAANTATAPDPALALTATNPAAAQLWTEIMTESARFLSARLKQDFDTQKALLACTTPGDMLKIQSEFFVKTMTDYAQEAHRMSQIMTEAGDALVKEARKPWSRTYDDVPL